MSAKSANKQAVSKKLMTLMKKRYKPSTPRNDLPILETMLYGICLEDATVEQAEASYEQLGTVFHDLNEVRVSSISELAKVFTGADAERKALRIRSTLQFIFEKYYKFDFELLRRKTLDLAGKNLAKLKDLSPFVRSFTLQTGLGGHLVPVDESMSAAAVWLGLVTVDAAPAKATTELKSSIRKNDAALFCNLLRTLVHDPHVKKTFERARSRPPAEGFDLSTAPERLEELFRTGSKVKRSSTKKKRSKTKKAVKKTAPKTKRTKSKTTARKKTKSSSRTKKVAKKAASKKTVKTRKKK